MSLIQSMYKNDSISFLLNGQYSPKLWLSQGVKQGSELEMYLENLFRFVLGCNLSPLLFSLYISGLGAKLNQSGLGIDLQNINISCILFADDLVVLGKSREALETLMGITRRFFINHKLDISCRKSKVMSHNATTGETVFSGCGLDPVQLSEVITYKYLGISLNCSPYNFFRSFNDSVKKKARSYLSAVLALTRSGPNRSALAHALWTICGLPSILYGTEIIPLTQDTLKEVERCNTAVGKFILQIPRSSSNVACYVDAGLKPVSAVIAEKVLLYAHRIMSKPSTYWPKMAMTDNLASGLKSPYTRSLLKIKAESNCLHMDPGHIKKTVQSSAITNILNQLRATSTTSFPLMSSGSSCTKLPWFRPKPWVSDSGISRIISSFRICNSGLGNRGPAKNGQFYKLCPLCAKDGIKALNNEVRQDYHPINRSPLF